MPRFCLHTCGITNLVRSLQLRLPLRKGIGRVLSTLVAKSKLTLSIEPDWRQYFWAALLQPNESLASAWFSLGRWSTLSECIGFAQRSSGLSPDPLKRASMLQLNCGWGQELGPLGVASCAVCFQSSLHHNIIVNPLMRRFVAALVTVAKTLRMSVRRAVFFRRESPPKAASCQAQITLGKQLTKGRIFVSSIV